MGQPLPCDGCQEPTFVRYITADGRGLCRKCWALYCQERRAAREG